MAARRTPGRSPMSSPPPSKAATASQLYRAIVVPVSNRVVTTLPAGNLKGTVLPRHAGQSGPQTPSNPGANVATKELLVAPKALSSGRTAELAPASASWSGPARDPVLIRAATRA